MVDSFISRRLSGKLLLMTIGFVMLAELVIFIPSAATYRQDWLMERGQQASLLAKALSIMPDFKASEALTNQFMDATDVIMVSTKRDGKSEFILGHPPNVSEITVVDLTETRRRVPRFRDAFNSFFSSDNGHLRILYPFPSDEKQKPPEPNASVSDTKAKPTLELLIPKEKLRWAMRDYFKRIFWLSLVIAVITGSMIYMAMLYLIIRPIENLAKDLSQFRDDPQKRSSYGPPTTRKDEIGQLEREFHEMKKGVRASLKQRERLATLGMAVAKINHDLRNVLASASLVSDRLASDQDERVSKMGMRLTRAIDRGVKLTGEVLNFSQSDRDGPELEQVRISLLLGEAASDTLGNFGSGPRKISFINNVETDITVLADADHAYRIFQNIFRNAAQAMAAIRDDEAQRDLSVEAVPAGENITIRVIDTGPGLPDKAKDNLFKAFASSTGRGNTGLGSTISKELARDLGGDLLLESTGKSGTIFNVTLRSA